MRTLRTLRPGQRGLLRLLRHHGLNLLRVRCRYDEETRREHLKTVERVCGSERGSACRLVGEGSAVARQVGWRSAGSRLNTEAGRGWAAGHSAVSGRRRWLGLETLSVARCRNQVSRFGNGCPYLETARPDNQTVSPRG